MKRFFNEWKTTIGTGSSLIYFAQSIKDEKAREYTIKNMRI